MRKPAENCSEAISGMLFQEPLIFERGASGRFGMCLPEVDLTDVQSMLPEGYYRDDLTLPEVTEPEVVRHYTRLSQWNISVDTGFYPLGSCTMKYNPKINDELASLDGFARIHPYQPVKLVQGALRLMYELERILAEISGMDAVTLQPGAGAHGELTGMLMVRAYHQRAGKPRSKVLIPDSAHGTNAATCALCGFQMIEIPSDHRGMMSPQVVQSHMDEDVAAIMLTNPNTLGLFEENILELSEIVHRKGGMIYCDGANLNAVTGIVRMGDTGVDLLHINLHKTFAAPHGGGGPGAGPLAVRSHLTPYLPVPRIEKQKGAYTLSEDHPESIGRVKTFLGHFGIMVRAYAYLLSLGAQGLREVAEKAVLNANYLRQCLKDTYHLPYDRICKHECVFSDRNQASRGIHTLDIAKRLIDYGFHPPTIYFPLIVKGALMIEPTESESKETLDRFIEALREIDREDADVVKSAPHLTHLSRLDEVKAARKPVFVAPEKAKKG